MQRVGLEEVEAMDLDRQQGEREAQEPLVEE
jgi:hypothetical protein